MHSTTLSALVLAAAALLAGPAVAQPSVQVSDAWVRASVPGQSGTGAFMKLIARDNARLVSVTSPVAGVAEVHEMRLEGEVMRMRAIEGLDLPAGRTVELRPGGYHLMLMDLKSPLTRNSTVPLTLVFTDSRGVQGKLEIKVPVATAAPGGTPRAGARCPPALRITPSTTRRRHP